MSSTRRQSSEVAEFRQERYTSSPAIERGLKANAVAIRLETMRGKSRQADRELIWAVHYLSHKEGLAAVAEDILKKYPERVGTVTMLKLARNGIGEFNTAEMRAIRLELPPCHVVNLPLKGETEWNSFQLCWETAKDQTIGENHRFAEKLANLAKLDGVDPEWTKEQRSQSEPKWAEQLNKYPASYPVAELEKLCWDAARKGCNPYHRKCPATFNLERELAEMCLNPEWDFAAGGPWYFPRLVDTLREYVAALVKSKAAATVTTSLGAQIVDALDYTSHGAILSLMQGEARTGKSFAALAWCDQHPGRACFVELPAFADDKGFFRAIADGLGLGSFINAKANEIRERVQDVLLTGDILLIVDEAQRLWPTSWRQSPNVQRVLWVMSMVNAGVPIALIATPQFTETQKAVEAGGWNSAQLTGRIGHFVQLPVDLSLEDLRAVAKSFLPEAGTDDLRAIASYARTSAKYLAAIKSISGRARYLAKQDGRDHVETADIRRAMQESVIPTDTNLNIALTRGGKTSRRNKLSAVAVDLEPDESATIPASRAIRPAASEAPAPAIQRGNLTEVQPH